ncbi:unnamed protein product [Dicrocoelium dendriticum]|nr:unnamed protein product [Dicrocoelium dendriticum]
MVVFYFYGPEIKGFDIRLLHLTQIDISAAESGIYENEPARRDDVVRYDDDQTDLYPPNSVKWASEAKNRFIQEATKAQERNQRQTVAVVDDPAAEHRFATEAKQAFLERQREVEEAKKNKARPDIMDIWGEQCPHSGVFENTPAARSADVVAGYSSSEEEETEEGEEEVE